MSRKLKLNGSWPNHPLANKDGSIYVGGSGADKAPISVQSMTTTRTYDVDATVSQIHELAGGGLDIIRIACPTAADAAALSEVVKQSPVPVITDIHFQSDYVFKSIEAGAAGVRINPGNIKSLGSDLSEIVAACKSNAVPLRIGVNAGSLDEDILKQFNYHPTPQALVASAVKEAREFEALGFRDFAISVKHHDAKVTIDAYKLLAQTLDYPLHLGVTEAGPQFAGTVKSAVAFGTLLSCGIGDTIRVSLSSDPIDEVRVGLEILRSLGLRARDYEIISCPTCGRKEAEVIDLVKEIEPYLASHPLIKGKAKGIKCAVMGCIVNGPGEAREADIGIAGGRDKAQLFAKGQIIRTVDKADTIPALLDELDKLLA